MKAETTQQEILLVATSTFSKRKWCETNPPEDNRLQSHIDQLEEICWNGLLNELLPEIIETTPSGKKLYLWQIRQAQFYIQIELCGYPLFIKKELSIDPYFFLEGACYN